MKKPLLLLLIGCGIAGTTLGLIERSSTTKGLDADQYRRMVEHCADTENTTDCVAGAAELVRPGNWRRALQDTTEVFTSRNSRLCHPALHTFGRSVSDRVVTEKTVELKEAWSLCGYGFLHGVYETLNRDLFAVGAAAEALEHCNRHEFLTTTDRTLRDNCVHAVGHSAWKAADGNVTAALGYCGAGPETRSIDADVVACSTGVYMSQYDSRLSLRGPLQASEKIEEIYPGCRDHSPVIATVCASFFSLSVRSSASHAAEHLAYCAELAEQPGVCFKKFGLHLALRALSTPGFDDNGTFRGICLGGYGSGEWRAGSQTVRDACREGAEQGAAVHGLGTDARREAACRIAEGAEECPATGDPLP